MSLLDPKIRTQLGLQKQSELLGASFEPTTLLEAARRDYVFAEVWSRPNLDRRSRFFIAIALATCTGALPEVLDGYIRGALKLGDITLGELREAALQIAVYSGWGVGDVLDKATTRVANELGLAAVAIEPLQSNAMDTQRRLDVGTEKFAQIAVLPAPPPATPFFAAGILNFVFGELWTRSGLDQRGRRWVTLACAANSASTNPIRAHIYAAMATGDTTFDEMQEFVLQYAIDGGWPKASVIQAVVLEMGKRVAEGLAYE